MLQIKALSYIYMAGTPFEKQAVYDMNITVEQGEMVGIIGHTGSGKSTLMQMICGLLKPASGAVLINNIDINEKGKRLPKGTVGMVFQYPEYQLFGETVYRDIAFGPKNQGLNEQEARERIYEAIALAGLSADILEKSPFDLSGGQKRRVAIAGTLAMRPRILILDEPTAGLDPRGRDEILMQIKNLRRTQNITVLLASHSMEDIAKTVDRVIVMNHGRLFCDGAVKDIFAQAEQLRDIGLNVPQISQVIAELRKNGIDLPADIFIVEEAKNAILSLLKEGP